MTSLTAQPAGFGLWWRQRWPAVLLAASLALNLFFVAGAVWIHLHAPPSQATRLRQIGDQLRLDPAQKTALEDYVRALRARSTRMRDETDPLIGAAWQELAKPQPDQARLTQVFDQVGEKRLSMMRDVTTQTLNFLNTLSPQQRAEFIAVWRERPVQWWRRPGEHH